MPKYHGLVVDLKAENKAVILIAPGEQSIPGAPEVSKKVCHEASAGSTLRIEAVNKAGAQAGDWVSLTRPSGLVKKNVSALFGMPLSGVIIGGAAGFLLMFGMGLPMAALVLCVAIGLLLGIMVGGKKYRALSEQNQPVINSIVKKRSELAAMAKDSQGTSGKDDTNCNLCSGCVQ